MSSLPARQRALIENALALYREGWFPMFDDDRRVVEWVQPNERGVLPLETFHVPSTLRKRVRSGKFVITCDRAFGAVIRACSVPGRGRERTWLCPEIIELFESLHRAGHAHSVEAWVVTGERHSAQRHRGAEVDERKIDVVVEDQARCIDQRADVNAVDPRLHPPHSPSSPSAPLRLCAELSFNGRPHTLVGGLYGLALGGAFCGESMFSRPDLGGTDASKVCLVHLVAHLRARGFTLLDAQLHNEHLEQFGLIEIAREAYVAMLEGAAKMSVAWGEFDAGRGEAAP